MRSRVETAAAFFILDWPKIWMLKEANRSGESAALAPPPVIQLRLSNKNKIKGLIRDSCFEFFDG